MIKKIKEMFSRKKVTITFTKTVRVFPLHMITDIEIVEAVISSTGTARVQFTTSRRLIYQIR